MSREDKTQPSVDVLIQFDVTHLEETMKRILLAALISTFAVGSAFAQSCESKAMGKDGKALSGAAKSSFVKKCKQDACESKAMGKDGKPLAGAAKNSFMTKCEKEA
jgi:hypothetical protein